MAVPTERTATEQWFLHEFHAMIKYQNEKNLKCLHLARRLILTPTLPNVLRAKAYCVLASDTRDPAQAVEMAREAVRILDEDVRAEVAAKGAVWPSTHWNSATKLLETAEENWRKSGQAYLDRNAEAGAQREKAAESSKSAEETTSSTEQDGTRATTDSLSTALGQLDLSDTSSIGVVPGLEPRTPSSMSTQRNIRAITAAYSGHNVFLMPATGSRALPQGEEMEGVEECDMPGISDEEL